MDSNSFSVEVAQELPPLVRSAEPARSPFLSVYELSDGEVLQDDPVREAYASLMNELHDEEFDEAVFELQCHGRAMHDGQLAMGKPRAEADRLVAQHFSQLIHASEAMVDAMAREFAPREQAGIVDHEIDAFVQGYTPPENLDPEFENFFEKFLGKAGRFLKKAASKAWQGVKKVALRPLFNLIKGAFRELMNNVLRSAIGKLPEQLRPAAQLLAQKLGFSQAPPAPPSTASADSAGSPVQAAAGDDAASPQEELNEHFAAALLAQDEVELELEAARFSSPSGMAARSVFADLDDARERFIHELESLGPDESAAPHIENFLPAVIKALQVIVPIIGRPRVVNFLAQPLAKLIKKLVGPEQAPALSQAIVSAGLALPPLNIQEMSEAETARLAPAAVAATIEETIRRVASLPEEVLDNQELLEGYALEAFEHAAAANLPAVLSESTYRRRPDLLEAGVNAGWMLLPLRGPKRYKRCTRSFHVNVSPQLAEEVESFEGASLAEYLQDQLGLEEGEQVEGQMYLYEALPGTNLTDIARGERETLGPGLSDEANAAQLHPLTPQAAGALVGKPGLGRALPTGSQGQSLAAGQRVFGLATGKRVLMMPGQGRRPRRLLRVNVTLDGVQDQVRVCAFFSEVSAQRLAARLRQAANLGLITAGIHRAIGKRLRRIFSGQAPARLRVVHAAMRPGQSATSALQNLPPVATQAFVAKLQAWLVPAFAEFIKAQAPRVIAETEKPDEGITLVFMLEHPPGLKELGQAMVERGAAGSAIAAAISKGAAPTVRVEVFAGPRCG
ncbi:MAG: hypothetical protein L0Y60_17935 [Beijerinckiaceae bacterium]|nr:hypothetical protein [Beijerinckiaceae bacterium]